MKLKKILLVAIALVLVAAVSVVGTLAFLKYTTTPVENIFVSGNVGATFSEPAGEASSHTFKMIPGEKIAKDPQITITANSENAYVFVEIIKSANFDTYFETLAYADGWSVLSGPSNIVLYRSYTSAATDTPYTILKGEGDGALKNGFVQVKTTYTGSEGEEKLTFIGGVIQSSGFTTALAAWTELAGSDLTLVAGASSSSSN